MLGHMTIDFPLEGNWKDSCKLLESIKHILAAATKWLNEKRRARDYFLS